MSVFTNGLASRLAASPSHSLRTHVTLNSGHRLPLLGWGGSDTKGQNTIDSVQAAVEAGYTVSIYSMTRCFAAVLLHSSARPLTAFVTKINVLTSKGPQDSRNSLQSERSD